MQNNVTCYEEAVELLYRIPRFRSDHSIEQIRQFMARMGQLDRQMKIVHIAGTNGKGSTSAYLAGLLEAGGQKVGLFTSPHLIDIRERIRINGQLVSKELFTEAVQYVLDLLRKQSEDSEKIYEPCFFDMLFFAAMYVFAKQQVDFAVLETGLGGRMDATNAVSYKEVTLITHIALDHTEYLGDTKELIATEKSGIMMQGVPCIVGSHNEEVTHVFLQKAAELEAPCRILGSEDYTCHRVYEKAVDFSYFSRYYGTIRIELNTPAIYQAENAALALAGVESLIAQGIVAKSSMYSELIQETLFKVKWEGRMEEVLDGVFLDGAHNLDGMQAFLTTVAGDDCEGNRILIFSALADKQLQEMADVIGKSGLFTRIIVTQLQDKRAADAAQLEALLQSSISGNEVEQKIIRMTDNEEAVRLAFTLKQSKDYIYVAGSLYLVSRMKEILTIYSNGKEFTHDSIRRRNFKVSQKP